MHALDTTWHRSVRHSLARDELPGFRPRYLGLSEAEFLALSCGHHTRRLKTDWLPLLHWLRGIPALRSITTNTGAALEQPLAHEDASVTSHSLHLHGPDQELEFDFSQWHCGFAVAAGVDGTQRAGLRFFNPRGDLLHSIEAEAPFQLSLGMSAAFHATDQGREQPLPSPRPYTPAELDAFDAECLRLWWQLPLELTARPVPGLPRVPRGRLLTALGQDHAIRVELSALHDLVECLDALEQESLRLTVANHGAVQRCRGRGFYAARLEEAILLHNEICTLRLLPQAVHAAWIVRKPTHQGERLGLELHDEQGELLTGIDAAAQTGGLRTAWATLLEAIREETMIKG
jgi:putative hemin transport protein